MTLEFLLGIKIKHLNHLAGAEGQNVGGGIHNSSLGFDGTAGHGGLILEINEGDLGGFDGDDPFVGFHGGEPMFDACFWDAQLLKL